MAKACGFFASTITVLKHGAKRNRIVAFTQLSQALKMLSANKTIIKKTLKILV